MHDKFKKRFRAPRVDRRLRQKIAVEAARRMLPAIGPKDDSGHLGEASEADYYAAKRKAAAVLGHTVRPGDLPSDSEIREQILVLARTQGVGDLDEEADLPEPHEGGTVARLADHVDRFAIYKLRLEPLEAVKQNVKYHPEGDALYHSLQVFEHARHLRPYDEEFLLAALLHDVGKAIDPHDHVTAGLEALRGAVTERTYWLIEHHMDLMVRPGRSLNPRTRKEIEGSDYYEDLVLLRQVDEAGRAIGAPVGTIDEALDYLRGLEQEAYLDDNTEGDGKTSS